MRSARRLGGGFRRKPQPHMPCCATVRVFFLLNLVERLKNNQILFLFVLDSGQRGWGEWPGAKIPYW